MNTSAKRKIGTNRGKARLWLEGKLLEASGWARGTRYNARFEKGVIVYEQAEDGARSVAGTEKRPIIDTNTDKIRDSLGDAVNASISITGKAIRITAAVVALFSSCTFGFFKADAKAVLVACEYSGAVRDAFAERGHDAVSCDLLESESEEGTHFRGDVLPLLSRQWDMVLAFPPCTRLCNSGVRWLAERDLWSEMRDACSFFNRFLSLDHVERVCVENPIMHKHARELVKSEYSQTIQPWQFGERTTKRTCLWLKGLPKLIPTKIIPKEQRRQDIWLASPGADRWKIRSRTFPGIAAAMAQQWG